MAIPYFEENLDIIGGLSDYPGSEDGLTAQEFKERFDVAGNLIKKFLNEVLIPQTNLTIDPDVIVNYVLTKALSTSGGSMTGDIAMGGNRVTGLADPVADGDAASKKYMDSNLAELEYHYAEVVLSAGSWSLNRQVVTVPGITDNVDLTVSPAPNRDNSNAYADAAVLCVATAVNTLAFECETVPDVDLTVNVKFKALKEA